MIAITQRERSTIDLAVSGARHRFSLMQTGRNDRGAEIAAMRLFIDPPERRVEASYWVILAKLLHNYPNDADTFVVMPSAKPILQNAAVARMVSAYERHTVVSGDMGEWGNRNFEAVVNALYNGSSGMLVMRRADFHELLATYRKQASDVNNASADIAKPVDTSVRGSMITSAAEATSDTMTMRKQQKVDGGGRCFRCESPKPRGITCAICHYTPRGMR